MNNQECSFSVVMTVYEQARQLEVCLPAFLAAKYDPGYEVIVVDESSSDDTDDVLKLLKQAHPHLYTTFLPKPNRNVMRRRMALSIGVKAAKNEWVILTDLKKTPDVSDWLNALSEAIDSSTEAVAGYFMKKGLRLQTFDDIGQARQLVTKAERKMRSSRSGRLMKYRLGHYDFIAVRRKLAFDILQYFEKSPRAAKLLGLRWSVLIHNLF